MCRRIHSKGEDEGEGELYSNPLTSFLGTFLPSSPSRSGNQPGTIDGEAAAGAGTIDFDSIGWDGPKKTGLSPAKMTALVDKGLREREVTLISHTRPQIFFPLSPLNVMFPFTLHVFMYLYLFTSM